MNDKLYELVHHLLAASWPAKDLIVEVEIRADVDTVDGVTWTVCIDGETTATNRDLGEAIANAVDRHKEK